MSSIAVRVVPIRDVRPHGNADRLELATVLGWQVAVKKGELQTGDLVVYFEAGTVLPRAVADELGVTNYLSEKTDMFGDRVLVVHRVKLRGEPSFGLAIPVPEAFRGELIDGSEVTSYYGACKFFPPVRTQAGDAAPDHPQFPAYTDIENLRSHPDIFQPGELVVATEKVHGANDGVGWLRGEDGISWEPMARSRTLRRKDPCPDLLDTDPARHAAWAANTYWFPWSLASVRSLMDALYTQGHQQAILYGEVYGAGIQDYDYGTRARGFRAFDLMIDGQYVDYEQFIGLLDRHGVERVPPIYVGPYDLEAIKAASEGESLVGGSHGREGVVVRPYRERHDPSIGRVVLKYVADSFLFGKAGEQDTTDR